MRGIRRLFGSAAGREMKECHSKSRGRGKKDPVATSSLYPWNPCLSTDVESPRIELSPNSAAISDAPGRNEYYSKY